MTSRPERLLTVLLKLFILLVYRGHTGVLTADTPLTHLRTLTTAREAHDLTLDEAAKSYPVHLKAVATYYDPYIDSRKAILFVHDSSGAVFIGVLPPHPLSIPAGALVEVDGVSARGDFAPIVDKGRVRVIGQSRVPAEAPRVSFTQLLTGKFDGQWVEMEGVVHSVRLFGNHVDLNLYQRWSTDRDDSSGQRRKLQSVH